MRTLNHVVLVLVLASFGFASFGCGDDSSSPVAPSSTPLMEAPSYAPAAAPSVRPVSSSSPDVDTVAPGDGRYGPNAYDFFAHVDSGMLRVALVEDAMATMRTASQPHRMRQVEVYHVISEPRHVLQTHGDPLYTGTVRLSGRLELPPIAVESCAPHEWIVVQAAELSATGTTAGATHPARSRAARWSVRTGAGRAGSVASTARRRGTFRVRR